MKKIPVIVAIPSQETLEKSAKLFQDGRVRRLDIENVKHDPKLALVEGFQAIGIGSGSLDDASLESTRAENSELFAVRAEIDEEDIDKFEGEQADGSRVFADPGIAPFPACGGDPPVGGIADVKSLLDVTTLSQRGLDGDEVAVAILDSGINLAHLNTKLASPAKLDSANSWRNPSLPASVLPGKHPVGHGTMCAFDALSMAPKATLLDYPILRGSAPGGSVMGGHLSTALVAYANLLAFWAVAFAPGGAQKYKALVVNNSWGMFHPSWDFPSGHPGRYSDNPNHPFNIIVSTLSRAGADSLFAAGNCGADCPDGRCQGNTTDTITGANCLPDVITVAGCDINDDRVGYSSQGPGISGMHPEKPDLTAYTHFLGSEAFGSGVEDSGTSAACPIAAGCVAALRTSASPQTEPPANMISTLNSTAKSIPAGAGWNRDFGFGILDPVGAANALGI